MLARWDKGCGTCDLVTWLVVKMSTNVLPEVVFRFELGVRSVKDVASGKL